MTITFREIVKLIHPDVNPHITNAGSKMSDVVRLKNNPVELYKLAVRWGVRVGNKNSRPSSPVRWVWVAKMGEIPTVNGYVAVRTRGNRIVKVVRVTPKRVYFYFNGRRTFAARKNVTVVREEKQDE